VMVLSSSTGDGTAEAMLVMARCRCRVMLAIGSHASDGAAKVTWPRHDVGAELCWR
jgi:hypothetical protein